MSSCLLSCPEPVDDFKEMEIDPAAIRSVDRRVGVMLKMIAGAEWPEEAAGCAKGPHKLKRTAEILRAELVITQEGSADAHINSDQSIFPPEAHVKRHKGEDCVGFSSSTEHSG